VNAMLTDLFFTAVLSRHESIQLRMVQITEIPLAGRLGIFSGLMVVRPVSPPLALSSEEIRGSPVFPCQSEVFLLHFGPMVPPGFSVHLDGYP